MRIVIKKCLQIIQLFFTNNAASVFAQADTTNDPGATRTRRKGKVLCGECNRRLVEVRKDTSPPTPAGTPTQDHVLVCKDCQVTGPLNRTTVKNWFAKPLGYECKKCYDRRRRRDQHMRPVNPTCLETVFKSQPLPRPQAKKPPEEHYLPRESARALWAEVTRAGRWTSYLERLNPPPGHRLCQCGEANEAGHVFKCVLSPPNMSTRPVGVWSQAWKDRQGAVSALCRIDKETGGRWTLQPNPSPAPRPRVRGGPTEAPSYNYWTSDESPGPATHKPLNEEANQETRHEAELREYKKAMKEADTPFSGKGKWWPYGYAWQKSNKEEKHDWC